MASKAVTMMVVAMENKALTYTSLDRSKEAITS